MPLSTLRSFDVAGAGEEEPLLDARLSLCSARHTMSLAQQWKHSSHDHTLVPINRAVAPTRCGTQATPTDRRAANLHTTDAIVAAQHTARHRKGQHASQSQCVTMSQHLRQRSGPTNSVQCGNPLKVTATTASVCTEAAGHVMMSLLRSFEGIFLWQVQHDASVCCMRACDVFVTVVIASTCEHGKPQTPSCTVILTNLASDQKRFNGTVLNSPRRSSDAVGA